MAGAIATQFRAKEVVKVYHAIVRGFVEDKATINYAYIAEGEKIKKEAITHYKKIKQVTYPTPIGRYPQARYSYVEIQPETGRRHQIRRHFGHLRHPIIGDKRYGDVKHNKYFKEVLTIPYLLLHAYSISFQHPIHHNILKIKAQLPQHFEYALELLGLISPPSANL